MSMSLRLRTSTTRPLLMNTTEILGAYRHTHGYPLYVTNPAAVWSPRAPHHGKLFLLRITPLSYVCSPIHTSLVVVARYAENSHTVLVRLRGQGQNVISRLRRGFHPKRNCRIGALINVTPDDGEPAADDSNVQI